MNKKLLGSFVGLLFGLSASVAQAIVIFDNGEPDPDRGWPYSDFNFPREKADDFLLTTGENVLRDIHWWGRYGGISGAPVSDDFTIHIFDNDGTKPSGTDFQTVAFQGAVGRELVEDLSGLSFTTYYKYWVNIEPIILSANTTYWLSIVNNTPDGVADWLWALTAGSGNSAGRDDPSDSWSTQPYDHAFYLTNDVQIPEPATLALMSLGLAGIGYRRKTAK